MNMRANVQTDFVINSFGLIAKGICRSELCRPPDLLSKCSGANWLPDARHFAGVQMDTYQQRRRRRQLGGGRSRVRQKPERLTQQHQRTSVRIAVDWQQKAGPTDGPTILPSPYASQDDRQGGPPPIPLASRRPLVPPRILSFRPTSPERQLAPPRSTEAGCAKRQQFICRANWSVSLGPD